MPAPTIPHPLSVRDCLAAVAALQARAQALQQRFQDFSRRFGPIFLGRQTNDGQPEALRPTDVAQHTPEQAELQRELVDAFQQLLADVSLLQAHGTALSEQTFPHAPGAPEATALQQELHTWLHDVQQLEQQQPALHDILGTLPDTHTPDSTLRQEQALLQVFEALTAFLDRHGTLPHLPSSSQSTTTSPTDAPTAGIASPATPLEPLPAAPTPVPASSEPFPATLDAVVRQLRYDPERHGTPDAYLNVLAAQLRTPEQIQQFLTALYRYDDSLDLAGRQGFLNTGRTEPREHWEHPLSFLTTLRDGTTRGDCDDLALAMTAILRRQGREAFTIAAASAVPTPAGGETFPGHVVCYWIERNGAGQATTIHRLDCTAKDGIDGRIVSQAVQPGEDEDSVMVSLFRRDAEEGGGRPALEPQRCDLAYVASDGRAFSLPATLALCKQAATIERALEAKRYDLVLEAVRAEQARTPRVLNLHLAELQLLLLTRQVEAATAVVNRIASDSVERSTPGDRYHVMTTHQLLDRLDFPELAATLRRSQGIGA